MDFLFFRLANQLHLRHLKMFLDFICLKQIALFFPALVWKMYVKCIIFANGSIWRECVFVTLSNHPMLLRVMVFCSPFFPAKECCLVWFQLAFAAGAMLLFAFPYIHIGAKLGFGKMLGRKFDLWKMLPGLQVCLCSFLMMDVHIWFIFTPIWARLPSWLRFFQMGWYGCTLGMVPLIFNPIYTVYIVCIYWVYPF